MLLEDISKAAEVHIQSTDSWSPGKLMGVDGKYDRYFTYTHGKKTGKRDLRNKLQNNSLSDLMNCGLVSLVQEGS